MADDHPTSDDRQPATPEVAPAGAAMPAAPAAAAAEVRPPAAPDEAPLIEAAVQGDEAAFAALYDRYADRVYRYCYYRLGNRLDAEDLLQQTFLQAWQAIGRYRQTGAPFRAWLLTISQNLIVSHYRRKRELTLPDGPIPQTGAAADPLALVTARLERDAVWAAIQRLKPDRQQVIMLRFIEGFSVSEVAAAVGKTDNHVRVLQHRALAELRQHLTEPAAAGASRPAGLGGGVAATVRKLVSAVWQACLG